MTSKETPFAKYHTSIENLQNKMKEDFVDFLKGRLHNVNVVFDLMKKYNVHLAGGAVLKFLNGEPLGESDLDFYNFEDGKKYHIPNQFFFYDFFNSLANRKYPHGVKYQEAKKNFDLGKFLDNSKYFKKVGDTVVPYYAFRDHGGFACELFFEPHRRYKGMNVTPDEAYNNNSNISQITDYAYVEKLCEKCYKSNASGSSYMNCCGITNLQIIHVDSKFKTMKEYMEKTFDFDFCKVSFDGEKFTVLHPKTVTEKRCQYKTTHDNDHLSMKRKKKYQDRGYTFDMNEFFGNAPQPKGLIDQIEHSIKMDDKDARSSKICHVHGSMIECHFHD